MTTIGDRFWSKVNQKNKDDCWEWNMYRDKNGYGIVTIDNKKYRVHRLSYELTYGKISDNILVCHKCDNTSCCNPDHLFLGSHADNIKDKIFKLRHAFGEKNGMSKLTSDEILKIKNLYSTGNYTQDRLGEIFDVTHQHISAIVNNKKRKIK